MYPNISIVIPTYNTEAYVERAIASVLAQTYQDFEIIVVDDASTDGTLDKIKAIADPRIKIVTNSQNRGAGAARNQAIAQAKGQWVALLDSDDWYAPERLEKLLEVAGLYQADMVADNLSLTQLDDTTVWSTLIQESGHVVDDVIVVDPLHFVKTDRYGQQDLHLGFTKPIFRRSFLVSNGLHYDEHISVTHDFWFYLSCLLAGARFVVTPDSYYFQFSRSCSLVSSSQIKRLDDDIRACKKFIPLVAFKQPALVSALEEGLELYRQHSDYYHVVEPLKEMNWPLALVKMFQHPLFFQNFARKLPNILWLRLKLYLFGDSLAAEKARYNSESGFGRLLKKIFYRKRKALSVSPARHRIVEKTVLQTAQKIAATPSSESTARQVDAVGQLDTVDSADGRDVPSHELKT